MYALLRLEISMDISGLLEGYQIAGIDSLMSALYPQSPWEGFGYRITVPVNDCAPTWKV